MRKMRMVYPNRRNHSEGFLFTIKMICDGLDITLAEFFSTPEFDDFGAGDTVSKTGGRAFPSVFCIVSQKVSLLCIYNREDRGKGAARRWNSRFASVWHGGTKR